MEQSSFRKRWIFQQTMFELTDWRILISEWPGSPEWWHAATRENAAKVPFEYVSDEPFQNLGVQDLSQWNRLAQRNRADWHIVSSTVYRKDVQVSSDVFSCFFLSVFLSFFLIGVFSGDWLPFLHMGETASGISKTLRRVNQGHMVQPTVIIFAMSLHKKQRYIYIYNMFMYWNLPQFLINYPPKTDKLGLVSAGVCHNSSTMPGPRGHTF